MSSLPVLEWSAAKYKQKSSKYWEGEPMEETRQHYANVRVQDWQAFRSSTGNPVTFQELLKVFRIAGKLYDRGLRLGDRQPLGVVDAAA